MVYYNEHDSHAAQWLRNLIAAGLIPDGEVDERDIRDIKPIELMEYTQCHFFAGIGGWSRALDLAGVPPTVPLWTGSCPCQPWSQAGARAGFADERHLWPHWFWLISQCRPELIFGEQVASALDWFDLVASDLESEGYAVGSLIAPAASVGAPHKRDRLWFVADDTSQRWDSSWRTSQKSDQPSTQQRPYRLRDVGELLADSQGIGCHERRSGLFDQEQTEQRGDVGGCGEFAASGFWSDCRWLACTDGKARPIEPGTEPLAHGVPGRVGRLRAYGNAIVPQVAAEIIMSYFGQ